MRDSRPVGIVGLGLLGSALAHRLLAGHVVHGFDIDAEKRAAFARLGGTPATSLAEIARDCSPILLAVFDTEQVEDVVENGLLPTLEPGADSIIVCISTCDPERVAALAARVAGRVRFLEAPVSGSSRQVEQGQGVALIGGDPGAADEIAGVLDALFAERFHVGAVGNGGRAKLATNHILGLNRLALAEGLVLAERMGLDPRAFLDVVRHTAAYSQVMDTKGPKMAHGDDAPQGFIHQSLKDFRLILDQAGKRGQELPLAALNVEVLEACIRAGEGELDNSAVIREIRRRSRPTE